MQALEAQRKQTGETIDHLVMRSLADTLQVDHATLFQVSTSGALIEGVSDGAVTVAELALHGDFGLGTFANFDGEMVILDGVVYQVLRNGAVSVADPRELVPFAVATEFTPERRFEINHISSLVDLMVQLDECRNTDNQFFAARLSGTFDYVQTRTVCKSDHNDSLVEVVAHQAVFDLQQVEGDLVGFWSPAYVKSVNVSGWHFHFLTADRAAGGHVLECRAASLQAEVQHLSDFRMAIPETAEFLAADLTGDPSAALEKAER
jgi:acetolactate decarboxylase